MTKQVFFVLLCHGKACNPQYLCGVVKIYASQKPWHKNFDLCQFLCQSPEEIRSILRRNDTTAKTTKPPQTQYLRAFERIWELMKEPIKVLFICHGSKLLFWKNKGKSRVSGVWKRFFIPDLSQNFRDLGLWHSWIFVSFFGLFTIR